MAGIHRWFQRRLVLSLAFPVGAIGTLFQARVPTSVSHSISCQTCKVVLTPLAVLDSAPNVPLIGGPRQLSADSRGRLFTSSYDLSQVLIFAPSGKFLTTLGRKGPGPGEFGSSSGLQHIRIGRGDSIYVSYIPNRIAVFSPDLRFARVIQVRGDGGAFVPLADGGLIRIARIASPAQIGLPVHVLRPDGEIIRSFGGDGKPILPKQLPEVWTDLALAQDGRSVWITNENYNLRHLSLSGAVLHDFSLTDLPWLSQSRPRAADTTPTGRPAPRPFVRLGGVDSSGLLWMNVLIPTVVENNVVVRFRYIVEVFDPSRGQVLLSQPSAYPIYLIRGSTLAFTVTEDDAGVYRYSVWRVAIERSGR